MHSNAAVILELARIADACARVHEEGAGNLRRLGNEKLARVHEGCARDMREVARKRKRLANSTPAAPSNDTPPGGSMKARAPLQRELRVDWFRRLAVVEAEHADALAMAGCPLADRVRAVVSLWITQARACAGDFAGRSRSMATIASAVVVLLGFAAGWLCRSAWSERATVRVVRRDPAQDALEDVGPPRRDEGPNWNQVSGRPSRIGIKRRGGHS